MAHGIPSECNIWRFVLEKLKSLPRSFSRSSGKELFQAFLAKFGVYFNAQFFVNILGDDAIPQQAPKALRWARRASRRAMSISSPQRVQCEFKEPLSHFIYRYPFIKFGLQRFPGVGG